MSLPTQVSSEDLEHLKNLVLGIEQAKQKLAEAQAELVAIGREQLLLAAKYNLDPFRDGILDNGEIERASAE